MKKLIAALLLVCAFVTAGAQKDGDQKEETKNLARVKKVNGIEAYVLCEPLRPYEVVVDAGTGLKAESLLTGGIINKSISGRVEQFVRNIMKQNGKVDAVVYSAGKRIVGVRFTDEAKDSKDAGIGRVSKVMGYPVYVMNEPVGDYEVVNNRGGGIKWKSLATGGLVNNSIEEDVQAMVKKLQSRSADAMLFEGGKDGMAISFSK